MYPALPLYGSPAQFRSADRTDGFFARQDENPRECLGIVEVFGQHDGIIDMNDLPRIARCLLMDNPPFVLIRKRTGDILYRRLPLVLVFV